VHARKLARRRRARALEENCTDERERQRKCRAAHSKGTESTALSRAGLTAPKAILRHEIVQTWDKMVAMSRVGFTRQIRVLLGRAGKKLGQDGTRNDDCHAPP
jgi:hypothetical protein